jgi:hypothetical protein
MQIIDAMRRSNTAEDICFLLTNYIETLQFYAPAKHLPAAAVALPVIRLDDIEERYFMLRETRLCDLARSHCVTHGDIVNEAEQVFYEALCCLRALGIAAGLLIPPLAVAGAYRYA